MEYLYSDEGQSRLAEGLLQHRPLRRHADARRRSSRPDRQAAGHHGRRASRRSPRSTAAKTLITSGLGHGRRRRTSSSARVRRRRTIGGPTTDVARHDRARARHRRALVAASRRGRGSGVVPFFLFAALFLILPIFFLVDRQLPAIDDRRARRSRTTPTCRRRSIVDARSAPASRSASSPRSSAGSSASCSPTPSSWAACRGSSAPRLMTFSGVASNFAGIPLALAFIFTLGTPGADHGAPHRHVGIDIYATGDFTIYSKLGLEIVYLYFQFPLMVLIIAPAIDGLKREWREASENMGASSTPVLAPRRAADPDADAPRHDDPAVRQRVRGAGDGLPADRRADPARDRCSSAPRSAATCSTTSASATPWRWAWS